MQKISEIAALLKPYVVGWIREYSVTPGPTPTVYHGHHPLAYVSASGYIGASMAAGASVCVPASGFADIPRGATGIYVRCWMKWTVATNTGAVWFRPHGTTDVEGHGVIRNNASNMWWDGTFIINTDRNGDFDFVCDSTYACASARIGIIGYEG